MQKRYADSVKVKIEDLASAAANHHAPRDDTTRWLARVDDRLHDKLARVDLVQPRINATLQGWLEQYVADREDDLKPESLRKLKQTQTKLLAFFDDGRELRKITVQDAADWRKFLKGLNLSEAAIKTHCGNAKTMLAEAVRRKLITDNPFALLKSGSTPSKYARYITPDEIDRVIEASPNAEWRLLFGLARYAGLRIPSESHLLTWTDVDFECGRMTVQSPKTEHHEGHEQRIIPITPKLMKLLQERFGEAEEGQPYLITIRDKGATIRQTRAIWKRASVEPWQRLVQTLRQSCEKEWAMTFPQYAVASGSDTASPSAAGTTRTTYPTKCSIWPRPPAMTTPTARIAMRSRRRTNRPERPRNRKRPPAVPTTLVLVMKKTCEIFP